METYTTQDGSRVLIKPFDLFHLERILENSLSDVESAAKAIPTEGIAHVTARATVKLTTLFNEEQLLERNRFSRDMVHPLRSLEGAYFGRLYGSLTDGDQKTEISSTEKYFRDIFIIEEAMLLEIRRKQNDETYPFYDRENTSLQGNTLHRITTRYNQQWSTQVKAYWTLKKILDDIRTN